MDRDARVDAHEAIQAMTDRILIDAARIVEEVAKQQASYRDSGNVDMRNTTQIATAIRDTSERIGALAERLAKAYKDMNDILPY